MLGSPSNAKYIKEFLDSGYINNEEANHLLFSIYSPSLSFILGFNYHSLKVIIYLYIINLIIYFISKRFFIKNKPIYKFKPYKKKSFTTCLNESFRNSLSVLSMILGVIIFYKIVISFLSTFNFGYLSVLIELTSSVHYIISNNLGFNLILVSILFGGISIHTQVKSILSDSYKYFLYGRALSLLMVLPFIL